MIVKVQISVGSSDGKKHMLIYNKDKSVMYEDEATDQVLKLMNGRPKLFFEAEVIPHPQNWLKGEKVVNIIKETEWQKW